MISSGNFYQQMLELKTLFASAYSKTYDPSGWRDDYLTGSPMLLRPVVRDDRFHLLHASAMVNDPNLLHHVRYVDAPELARLMRRDRDEGI